ncbi:MAG TPA: HAMP domain-containing sensor histidine kinase [Nitrososphaeraceae archaeon]|nr:HAMP domain-containing sensor histidine kinase [Nitrososphaeraceae archaeon]
MGKYNASTFIHSSIGSQIAIFVLILIFLILANFVIVSYFQSQTTYLGNSINIAGKNRFLTANLLYEVSEYLFERNSKSSSTVNSAIDQLESNILELKQGGNTISEIALEPLPREFLKDWSIIYEKLISLKTNISKKIINSSTNNGITNSETSIDKDNEASKLEREALSLVDSSNLMVTKLSDYLKNNSESSLLIQQVFTILIIVITTAFVFYISSKILKPILSLSSSISEINGEKLNIIINQKEGSNSNKKNELLVLSNSLNYMVDYIKNIKKQDKIIKELENANQELKYKDQLKNEFINVAAHEIKTPIQPIIALAEVIQYEGIDNIEKNKEFLDIIFRNSRRLLQISEDVLDVARIESGSFSLNKEKFNLNELISEILKEYEQKIRNKKNIKLLSQRIDNNKELTIDADKNRLSQVIHNLLNNAIKFTEEGSIIVIVERKKEDITNNKFDNEILVSVRDTGRGIHPNILPKLFTKFATKSPIPGTGLGLFISKSIIEMHGGKIWAINNKEIDREKGIGSTFTFSLPIKR